MAVKKTRRKLFKVAKELNLSHHSIEEFLQKKGYEVSGLNTPVDDEMYDDILKRFSQEKVKAEKIARRRSDRKKDEQPADAVSTAETPQEEAAPAEEPVTAEASADTSESAEAFDKAEVHEVEDQSEEDVKISETAEAEDEESAEAQDVTAEQDTETAESAEAASGKEKGAAAAGEADEAVAEAEEEEEDAEGSEKPQVGDIIDHPMAKKFMEKQKEKKRKKTEKQKKVLKQIKEEAPDKKKKADEKDRIPRRIRAIETEEPEELQVSGEETAEETLSRRKKEKEKKKQADWDEGLTEKERRRRKALEMIRKDGKKGKGRVPVIPPEAEEAPAPGERKRRTRKKKEVDQQEVEDTLKKTLASMQEGAGRKKRKRVKDTEEETEVQDQGVITVSEFITVQDLANLMDVPVADVIKKCLELGQMVSINQRLDMDMIRLLAEDFGFRVQEEEEFGSDYIEDKIEEEDRPEDYESRHPVVTVMGHVDHGKTSVLDYIRKTNVVAGESGGITQHIGAYVVETGEDKRITFLDTPGHEAFTAMRSRGAQVTDIVVLVVAADDRVMPQTEEAIDHARAAGVPIIIAINKVDKPNADPKAIRKQLADRNILVEDWGGKYQVVEVSAKTGQGIPDLLETISLEAELLELNANPKKRASGVVIESFLDKGKGPVATVLVEQGTLHVGDDFIMGQFYGRVRALLNERGQRQDEAGPGYPVQILGIDGVPEAGDKLIIMPDERSARDIAQRRQQLKREQDFRQIRFLTLDEISRQIAEGQVKELNIIVKADVDGSAQALTDSLLKISHHDVAVKVVRRAVGPISESDIMLAAASQAIIIGFHVRPTLNAKNLAEQEQVDIRLYKVIYDAIDDVKKALEGLLEPEEREQVLGMAEVREVFKISRLGTVAGCYMLEGKINRNSRVRLIRNDVEIYEGRLSSLKRFKEDVREVASGYEFGLMIENYNDLKVGDHVEAFEVVQEKRTLQT
ncbi:MAG: translation initiation factor IF-2 [Calditrichia bacterium]